MRQVRDSPVGDLMSKPVVTVTPLASDSGIGTGLRVKDIMTRRPVTVTPETPIGPAFAVMREHDVRHLPVVDPDGRLIGIVTDRDLRQASLARFHALRERNRDLTVDDVMTWAVITTAPDVPVAQAIKAMYERRIGSLPVVAQGRLVGILTEQDLLRALVDEFPDRTVEMESLLW